MKKKINRVVEVIETPVVCLITRLMLKMVNWKIRKAKDGKWPMSELVEVAAMLESEYLPALRNYWYSCRFPWSDKACLHYVIEVYKALFKIDCLFHDYNMADF